MTGGKKIKTLKKIPTLLLLFLVFFGFLFSTYPQAAYAADGQFNSNYSQILVNGSVAYTLISRNPSDWGPLINANGEVKPAGTGDSVYVWYRSVDFDTDKTAIYFYASEWSSYTQDLTHSANLTGKKVVASDNWGWCWPPWGCVTNSIKGDMSISPPAGTISNVTYRYDDISGIAGITASTGGGGPWAMTPDMQTFEAADDSTITFPYAIDLASPQRSTIKATLQTSRGSTTIDVQNVPSWFTTLLEGHLFLKDKNNRLWFGVKVDCSSADEKYSQTVDSDATGLYRITGPKPGSKITCAVDHLIDSNARQIAEKIVSIVSFNLAPTYDWYLRGSVTVTINADGTVTPATHDGVQGMDIILTVEKIQKGGIGSVLDEVLGAVLNGLSSGFQWASDMVFKALNLGNRINQDNDALQKIWQNSRNISLSLLTLALIIIAFANIVGFDIEKYGLNRVLPKLIIAIVLAWLSYFICSLLLNMSSALSSLMVGQGMDAAQNNLKGITALSDNVKNIVEGAVAAGNILGTALISILVILIGFFAFLWLIVVCLLRVLVIVFLVAIAPIAVLMNALPFTEFLYKMWLTRFLKWTFMGPAIVFFLWVSNEFLTTGISNADWGGSVQPQMYIILAAVGVVLAASMPMMIGGEVIKGVQSAGKKGLGYAKTGDKYLNKSRVQNYAAGRRNEVDRRNKLIAEKKRLEHGLAGHSIVSGIAKTPQAQRAARDRYISLLHDEMGASGMDEADHKAIINAGRGKSDYEKIVAWRELARRKAVSRNVNGGNAADLERLMGIDGTLRSSIFSDDRATFAALENNGIHTAGPTGTTENAQRAAEAILLKEWKKPQFKHALDNVATTGAALVAQISTQEGINAFIRESSNETKAMAARVLQDSTLRGQLASVASGIRDHDKRRAYLDSLKQIQNSLTVYENTHGGPGAPGADPLA